MLYKVYTFDVPGAPGATELHAYIADASPEIDPDIRRPAVVICAGGCYRFTCTREEEPVALRLMTLGFNAFILRYHTASTHYYPAIARYPVAQLEASRAIAFVKEHAEETHTDPERVFILGFSAGGHLAASLGVLGQRMDWAQQLGLDRAAIRPRGMVLCYPVISSGEMAHQESFDNLLGERRAELGELMSLEKQVTETTVPAFLWHTYDDPLVPVENSLMLAAALRAHGIPFEMHIYPHGAHGLSLANAQVYGPAAFDRIEPDCQEWIERAAKWMMTQVE